MINKVFGMRWTITFALCAGYLLSGVSPMSIYDSLSPVVVMEGKLIKRDVDSVVVHVSGTKLRSCQFLQIDSYSVDATGRMRDANETRIDGMDYDGASKPVGEYDLGMWRIYPLGTKATGVQMYVEHSCAGRIVLTKIADINLTN